jgi:hypothetical protein
MVYAVVSSRVSMKGMEIEEPVAAGEEGETKAEHAEAHGAGAAADEETEEES